MRQVAWGAFLLVGSFLTSPEGAHGQSTLETIWGDFKTAPGDVWYVWSAPARVDSDGVAPLVLFTGATLLVAANDATLQQWFREHPNSFVLQALEPFRQRNGLLSELGRNHKVMRGAAAGYVVGLVTGWDWLREASLGCAVGNTANALPRGLTYRLIARARPSGETDPYQFDFPGGDWAQHSFFGGHAANAFTCASFFAHRWDLGYAEPVVWILATGVSLGRTADEAHWMSDTVVGVGFGWAIGRMIARRYEERERERNRGGDTQLNATSAVLAVGAAAAAHRLRLDGLQVTPVETEQGTALLLSARLRF